MPLRIPTSYKVTTIDEYVCTTVRLPAKPHKLIGVIPMASQEVVHHILLFGASNTSDFCFR